MAQILAGKWKSDRSEKFDEYLTALGVGLIKRKTAGQLTQHLEIKVDGDKLNVKSTTTFSTQENELTLGQKYTSPAFGLADGEMECISTFADGKLVIKAEPTTSSLKATEITRELVGEELLQTMKCGDVICKRYYKKEA